MRAGAPLALFLLVVALGACKQDEGKRCQFDSDCKSGLVCCYGVKDPDPSEIINGGVCQAEENCRFNEDGGADAADGGSDTVDLSPDVAPDVTPDTQPDIQPDTQPDTVQPDTLQPDTQPDTVQPDTVQPDTVQPDTTAADSAQG